MRNGFMVNKMKAVQNPDIDWELDSFFDYEVEKMGKDRMRIID